MRCAPIAGSPYDCEGYRLPTEAEWEYAARAGTTTATYTGDLDVTDCSASAVLNPIAWYCGNSSSRTHPVALKDQNDWGLHDMLGNVWEWCHDSWVYDLGSSARTDPYGPAAGVDRVGRGGYWAGNARDSRAASRDRSRPNYPSGGAFGFRPVRTIR